MLDDTIAAVSTPAGTGAIAVIRVSGSESFDICSKIIKSNHKFSEIKSNKIIHGFIKDINGNEIDEALIIAMRGPATFTGEDTVEINCHGGMVVTRNVLAAVLAAGARQAGPGEFSRRAFANGKIDLAKAEGIINLIDAKTSFEAQTAFGMVRGGLSEKIYTLSDNLVDISAELMAYIDYPEEDLQETPIDELIAKMELVNEKIIRLIKSYDTGIIIKEGIDTAIIGMPNVGKSSVMNVLSGSESSIVTDVAGTTRDVVKEQVNIGKIVLNLMDTAGIHATSDKVEAIGVERSRDAIEKAGLILAVFDATRPLQEEDIGIIERIKNKPAIALINKTDLDVKIDTEKIKTYFANTVIISCADNRGFDELYKCIENMFINEEISNNDQIITSARHYESLVKSNSALTNALDSLRDGQTCDIASMDLEQAIEALGEITGKTVSERIVERIFEKFCVGK